MSKLPQILLDFASAPSLQDWENHDFLTLKPDTTLGKVLVKKGHEFDPVVSSPPLDWQPLRYHELVVQLHAESFIYIKVSDEIGEERTLLYSSAILFGMNKWKEFHVPLGKDVSDGKWHSLLIDIPRHMEQAQWPGFAKVDCLRLRGEVALARIRGCDDEDSLIEPATDSPYVFPFPVLRMSKLPQILLDFASNPPLQGWENSDSLTLEYDDTLGKRVLVKKGYGFEQAVSSPPCDWQPLQYYELTVRLHPESVICINVSDKRGKDRTLLYSATRPSELNQWKEFHVPLGKDVSDGNWHSLIIDIPKHMGQAHWPGFEKVNWLRLRGEVALAGIRGCADEDSLRGSAIASLYPVVVPSSRDPAKFVPYVISNNRIDLVDTDDLLEVARSPQHGHELMLWLSVEDPDKASAMIEEIGPDLLASLSDSPQDVRVLFSALRDQSPSVGKLLASMITPQFETQMAKSPEDWGETQLILQRLRALEKVYDFFDYFVEADHSDYGKKKHCQIKFDKALVSGGVTKRGILQHPPLPEEGPSRLPYPPIQIPDHIQELRLDFFIGILDKWPDTGKQQPKFSKDPCKEDAVKFNVRINGKVELDEKLNSVGWVRYSLPIELPTDRKLIVEFITDAMSNAIANWAAWGEPRLLGIRAVRKGDTAAIASKRPAKGTDSRTGEYQVDFAVITALEKEAKAVVSRLESPRIERFEDKDIRTYHCGTIPIQDTDHAYRVVVVLLPSMGEISAANAVTDTIARWNPRFVLMVGIAGGIPQDDLDLGDVVVADQIIGYEYGKVTEDGIEPRDRVYPVSALLLDRVRNFWDESWAQQVNVPRPDSATRAVSKLFIGPIASGNKVIASTEFRQRLKTRWPKLVALEMEGEGVFAAVFDRPQIRNTLVIRGICDMADERKADEWREYAANAAAAFTVSFLKGRPVEPQE